MLLLLTGMVLSSFSCDYATVPRASVVTEVRAGCEQRGGVRYVYAPLEKWMQVCDVAGDLAARLPLNWVIVGRGSKQSRCQLFPAWTVTKADIRQKSLWVCVNSPLPDGFATSAKTVAHACSTKASVLLVHDLRPAPNTQVGTVKLLPANPDGTFTDDSGEHVPFPPE